jgi:hypothetical protein
VPPLGQSRTAGTPDRFTSRFSVWAAESQTRPAPTRPGPAPGPGILPRANAARPHPGRARYAPAGALKTCDRIASSTSRSNPRAAHLSNRTSDDRLKLSPDTSRVRFSRNNSRAKSMYHA